MTKNVFIYKLFKELNIWKISLFLNESLMDLALADQLCKDRIEFRDLYLKSKVEKMYDLYGEENINVFCKIFGY